MRGKRTRLIGPHAFAAGSTGAIPERLRPFFAANHRWAMARGEESLALELRRRRARTEAERQAIPAPPRSTFR